MATGTLQFIDCLDGHNGLITSAIGNDQLCAGCFRLRRRRCGWLRRRSKRRLALRRRGRGLRRRNLTIGICRHWLKVRSWQHKRDRLFASDACCWPASEREQCRCSSRHRIREESQHAACILGLGPPCGRALREKAQPQDADSIVTAGSVVARLPRRPVVTTARIESAVRTARRQKTLRPWNSLRSTQSLPDRSRRFAAGTAGIFQGKARHPTRVTAWILAATSKHRPARPCPR